MTPVNVTERFAVGVGSGVTDDSERILLAGGSTYTSYMDDGDRDGDRRPVQTQTGRSKGAKDEAVVLEFEKVAPPFASDRPCSYSAVCNESQYETVADTPTSSRTCGNSDRVHGGHLHQRGVEPRTEVARCV